MIKAFNIEAKVRSNSKDSMSQRDAKKDGLLYTTNGVSPTPPKRIPVPSRQNKIEENSTTKNFPHSRHTSTVAGTEGGSSLSRRHTSAESRKALPNQQQLAQSGLLNKEEQQSLKRSDTSVFPKAVRKVSSSKICASCGQVISGQYVRALGNIYHLECFRCHDCNSLVASKFFPIDDPTLNKQVPLCETDYFRRLDLLCASCGMALRGYYITALNKKFHIEHFTCSLCYTVFGPNDSYYEYEGKVYCHYHYSTLFAARCCGCDGPILRQFVEVYRNGVSQNWHVPCHMIYKFWNVKLCQKTSIETSKKKDSELSQSQLRKREKHLEQKIFHIWHALSYFEEYTASCISDMLLLVSNGEFTKSVICAQKFIRYIEILFKGIDSLETILSSFHAKSMPYVREAKLLCKKLVSIFALLAKCHNSDIRDVAIVQDFLSLFTGLAHYLKLLIRISLTGGLRLEQDHACKHALPQFLQTVEEARFVDQEGYDSSSFDMPLNLANASSDLCYVCHSALEEDCVLLGEIRCHIGCLSCTKCKYNNRENYDWARWNNQTKQIECYLCYTESSNVSNDEPHPSFEYVSRLSQYIYLLRIALVRLYTILMENNDSSQRKPLSVDPKQENVSSTVETAKQAETTASSDSFRKYANTLNDLRHLKSSRNRKATSNETQSSSNSTETSKLSKNVSESGKDKSPHWHSHGGSITGKSIVEQASSPLERRMDAFDENRAFTLDDIPKVISEQRNREHRPNAFRHMPSYTDPSYRKNSGAIYDKNDGTQKGLTPKSEDAPIRYLSDLSNLELLFTKHVAVLILHPLVRDYYSLDELMEMSDLRKGGFWEKFGKAFKGKDAEKKNVKKKGTFGVPLEILVERNNAQSTVGTGVGVKHIPAFIGNTLAAMKRKDMSVVGVFRKNGNIRRLKELSDMLDVSPDSIDYEQETPIQLAALLKKFLRELPDPLLTFKLFGLFITSSKLESEEERMRVLHLTICLLPKGHRDTMEVIFGFLYWVASFSHIDDEVGSKMDIHNLATVITPNILYSKSNDPVDESFLAIEAVHLLIENFEKFCEVPREISLLLDDPTLFYNNAAWTSKELYKRCEEIISQMSLDERNTPKHTASTKRKRQPIRRVTTNLTSDVPSSSEVADTNSLSSTTKDEASPNSDAQPKPQVKPQHAVIRDS